MMGLILDASEMVGSKVAGLGLFSAINIVGFSEYRFQNALIPC